MNTPRALVLLLTGTLLATGAGCNDIGDEGNGPEAYAEVTKVELVGNSATDGEDTTLNFTVLMKARNHGAATSFTNDVIITDFVVTWSGIFGSGGGVINSGFTPVGSTATIVIFLVSDTTEPVGASAIGQFTFFGRDLNGHSISFDHAAQVWFTP